MANVTEVDQDENSIVLAHCTVPRSLTTAHEITTHFETDLSVALRGTIEPGPVTVLKIGGPDLSKWWVSGGEILENLRNDTGCRTQVRVHLNCPVSYFLDASLANHHILLLGDHAERIERFLKFALQ
jgi:L-fucose isomerase-like protein